MNIDWPKLIGCVVAVIVGAFWIFVLVAFITGCSHTTETETDVSWCVGYCGIISQDTETTTEKTKEETNHE